MSIVTNTPALPLYLGCPVWNCDGWGDIVYPQGTKRPKWLSWYSQMFNCVEGNCSFYAIPSVEHARRWVAESANGFRYCMKFPREISHERSLLSAEIPTRDFLAALGELARGERLGVTFLQLGPAFGADRLDVLSRYLHRLPREFSWAVEVRHPSWFDGADNERRLDELLIQLQVDKVIFDSRPLFQTSPDDVSEQQAQSRKPQIPLRRTVTGKHPMLRLIGRNRIELADELVAEWISTVARWLESGLIPYVFTHTPDDTHAPSMARRMWERMSQTLPGPTVALPEPPRKPRQLELL